MKTFIVLIPVHSNNDSRRQCENIENTVFTVGNMFQATALDVRSKVIDLIDREHNRCGYDLSTIEVEPISDFMDRVNDEEFDPDNYFMTYVKA